ncbi:hypothetical protein GE061_016364 [Apolygus lucorum]|uniref:Dipeptidase n=1 Tax=Apolygus lucorum TaxID=248454 RepID=A0A8S9XK02_APOLU|nr:hypothetical protein GE061_016364 [Apolygus lucorum]
MFTDLGKQKSLIFFGVLAFFVVGIVILVCCLDLNGEPSTGAELLASSPFIVGKSEWSRILKANSDQINTLAGEPWDIDGLAASSVSAQLYSVGASNCTQAQYKDAVTQTLSQIDVMLRVFEKYNKYFKPAISTTDIDSARIVSKISGFLAVDGGYALDSRFSVLRDYYRSTSSMDTPSGNTSLSSFGERFILEMNRLGILIDLTGSDEQTQRDTITLSRAPVIFTSSSSNNLTSHPMNVNDSVLRELAGKGGLIMISFKAEQCCDVLTNCTVDNIVEHIHHTANVAGKWSVGIGGDVGMSVQYPQGILGSTGYTVVFDRLLRNHSWTITELQNLAGNNFIRVMKNVEQVARTMQKESNTLPEETEISIDSIPADDRACYSEPTQQLMAEGSLPITNALLKFQHKMLSFQDIPDSGSGGNNTASSNGTSPGSGGNNTASGNGTTPASEGNNTASGNGTTPGPGGNNTASGRYAKKEATSLGKR